MPVAHWNSISKPILKLFGCRQSCAFCLNKFKFNCFASTTDYVFRYANYFTTTRFSVRRRQSVLGILVYFNAIHCLWSQRLDLWLEIVNTGAVVRAKRGTDRARRSKTTGELSNRWLQLQVQSHERLERKSRISPFRFWTHSLNSLTETCSVKTKLDQGGSAVSNRYKLIHTRGCETHARVFFNSFLWLNDTSYSKSIWRDK